ncbi:MAG: hypothetical protein ABH873_00525 [Candidatus Firestonebacteria bacterium]
MYKKVVAGCFVVSMAFALISCTQKPSQEEMIERGKYLVNAAGVLWYHTPIGKDGSQDFSKLMAGSSVGYQGSWGVTYPKNLTPDVDTGIGGLTDDEVISLIKNESNSGKLTMFSYHYKDLTDEDLKCIVAFLRNLPPVSNKIQDDLKPGEAPKTSVINLNVVEPKVIKAAPVKKTPAKPKAKPKTTKKTGSTKTKK